MVNVILSSTHRQTAVTNQYCCLVDVTEEFAFLATTLALDDDRCSQTD